MNISLMLRLYRLAAYKLDKAEEQTAAVKSRNGKQIENTNVDGNER